MSPKPLLRFTRPKFKRLPPRNPVTVCIAALAKHEKKEIIVAVSDTKLSAGGMYSQEMGAMKLRRIHGYWMAMIAGEYSQHRAICEAIEKDLGSITQPSLAEVSAVATKIYVDEARRFAEESILSRFGLSMREFIDSRKKIGDSLFERTWVEISQVNVGCELMIFGFDADGAHIFSISSPTSSKPTFVTEYDSPSFAAIGSGSYIAEGMMYAFRHLPIHSLYQTIYQVCVAKFYAETASDVGEFTALHILQDDGEFMPHEANIANDLRERWKMHGKLKVLPDEVTFIEKSLKQSNSQKSESAQ
jgi:hypothetical protein